MGNMFGTPPTTKELVRQNSRVIKKSIRELNKSIADLNNTEKQLKGSIKKEAAAGNNEVMKIKCKDLFKTRAALKKFSMFKSHMEGIELKLMSVKSMDDMKSAMQGVTKAMSSINQQIKLPELSAMMAEFQAENMKFDTMQETMSDAMDDMYDEDTTEDEEAYVDKILAELGMERNEQLQAVPTGSTQGQPDAAPVAPAMTSNADAELEERLGNLRRNNT